MANKTINQALKDLFLGLGGDPSALADNTSVSDYIADLESAIKAAATAELPTPAEANVGKVATVIENEGAYSWGAETPSGLPAVAASDNYKSLIVSGGEWIKQGQLEVSGSATGNTITLTFPTGFTRSTFANLAYGDMSRVRLGLFYMSSDYMVTLNGKFNASYIDVGENQLVFTGVLRKNGTTNDYNVIVKVGLDDTAPVDAITVTAIT